jgi:hypothetical protein
MTEVHRLRHYGNRGEPVDDEGFVCDLASEMSQPPRYAYWVRFTDVRDARAAGSGGQRIDSPQASDTEANKPWHRYRDAMTASTKLMQQNDNKEALRLTVIHHEFPSAVSAKEYLEKRIARDKALNVLKSGKKRDSKNQDVGTRLEGELRTDQPSGSVQAIFWTNDLYYYEVTSVSMKDALEFEKLYQ